MSFLAAALGLSALGGLGLAGANFGLGVANSAQNSDLSKEQLRESQRQFDAQMEWAKQQQAWLERMSSTAHQREVDDLRAAGLNPVLSATGGSGASTPSSVSSGSPTASGSAAAAFSQVAQSALATAGESAMSGIKGISDAALDYSKVAKNFQDVASSADLTPAQRKQYLAQADSARSLSQFYGQKSLTESALRDAQLGELNARIEQQTASAASSRREAKWIDYKAQAEVNRNRNLANYLQRMGQVQSANAVINALRLPADYWRAWKGFGFGTGPFQQSFPLERPAGAGRVTDSIFWR